MRNAGSDSQTGGRSRRMDDTDGEGLFVEGKTVLDPDGGAVADLVARRKKDSQQSAWLAAMSAQEASKEAAALVARDASLAINRLVIDGTPSDDRASGPPRRSRDDSGSDLFAHAPTVMNSTQFEQFEPSDARFDQFEPIDAGKSQGHASKDVADGVATVAIDDGKRRPEFAAVTTSGVPTRSAVATKKSIGRGSVLLGCALTASLTAAVVVLNQRERPAPVIPAAVVSPGGLPIPPPPSPPAPQLPPPQPTAAPGPPPPAAAPTEPASTVSADSPVARAAPEPRAHKKARPHRSHRKSSSHKKH